MISLRRCSRAGCGRSAVATLTYNYADSQAVLGPLAARNEPGAYDLCSQHARSLSAPRGWEVIRLPLDGGHEVEPDPDDLVALANAVREAANRFEGVEDSHPAMPSSVLEGTRRRHLRVISDSEAGAD